MRNRFDEQLFELNREIIEMGSMCEEAIACATKALTTGDLEQAVKVINNGFVIDQMERDIEGRCMKLLLHQQPVARDLRLISAALKLIKDMERIGDQAEDIAGIVVFLNGRKAKDMELIGEMANEAIEMVTSSIDAFVKKDVELAEKVIAQDDVVDDYFSQIKDGIITLIAEDSVDGEFALDLLMIAKYLERIGDHATNIAEWVIYYVTGTHPGRFKNDMVRGG
ncbi:MAG: phosphate signaling complex protein PhoU [Lentisphaerae bacterium]|jgi:phosphate transport system protein|nr:phosphate signaling complex protein PhoU [Lentisphaerota bacterium]